MGAGAQWKALREERGLSLDQAAARLRISRRYLQGIEEGDYSGWPARVFSSGYIRAYAKLLETDPEPVLTEYYRAAGGGAPAQVQPVRPAWVERERQRGSRRLPYTVAAGVVLLVGVVLAWISFSLRGVPKAPPQPAAQAPAAAPAAPAAAPDNASPAPAAPAASDNAAGRPSEPGAEPPSVSEQTAGAPGAGGARAPLQLFLEASEVTWLMYSLDDAEPVDVTLYPGDRLNIQAGKRIYLKLGNAGGVAGTLNGRRLAPFGGRGQVKEVRLGP